MALRLDATLLVGMTDPLGRQLRFDYDAAGRRVREIERDGSVWEFRYDANGSLLEEISPDGYSTHYTYDAWAGSVRLSIRSDK